eukprot:GSChrysophyteH1.ASY1.ANO1.1623.1 assembled CDS
MEQAEAALLDFSKPFECTLLDQIVAIANDGSHADRSNADDFLVKLRDNPDIWKRTYDVLEQSKQASTKFFIMQALSHMINTRWQILPEEQKQNLKNYIQDWPHNWPDFISDIVASSKTSESLCENNMRILRLLSEEVFDYSLESMTAAKIKTMKESLNEEFSAVFHLCQLVMENSQKVSLVLSTLQTLQRFLTWIPLGFVFETSLLPNLLRFLTDNQNPAVVQAVDLALQFLLRISKVRAEDDEVFKITLDFWQYFAKEFYTTTVFATGLHGSGGMGTGLGSTVSHVQSRYSQLLHELRVTMIDHMAKPEEVIVVENDDGEIVREVNPNLEVIAQYKTMREAIVLLTNLNYNDTELIMLEKLDAQVSRDKFTWDGLNTLCWAIGSISGAMSEAEEKRFLVIVIKDLLRLCENEKKKNDKAVVASNIMYIVGQYPRFLRAHWKFLKTVVNKLFEFMHEHHPGVQDMACDTFLKIAQKCKRKFMTPQSENPEPFILTLISELHLHTVDLQPHQQWRSIMMAAQGNVTILSDPNTIKTLTSIVKINTRVCSSAGTIYVHQLSVIFLELMNVYQYYSKQVNTAVATEGPIAVKMHQYKIMKDLNGAILDLLTTFLEVTLEVITSNMLDHPEHRVRFFKFLQCANEYCFTGLFSIPPGHQKMVIDSIVWAVKHTDRNISETALEILQELLGFKLQATILMNLFHLVQKGHVHVPLTQQVIAFVTGCFDDSFDINAFKQHLRDFLINVKEYAAGDRNDDLYNEERELQQEKVSDELKAYQKSVPGLLKPSELEEEQEM